MLVNASAKTLGGDDLGGIGTELQGLVAYTGVMIVASLMLFKFVWQE